jgi:hypothetical protein
VSPEERGHDADYFGTSGQQWMLWELAEGW